MIKFFRKIRQNLLFEGKTGKYFKYAIGEIVLVVIGILIALQINNWNEDKKTQLRLTDFLTEIQKDLSDDILKANDIIDIFIAQDSILRNIRQNKVSYSIENFTENQQSLMLIYEFENFRLQSKGYEGLVKNIDNIPEKYAHLMDNLNFVYVTNKYDMEAFNERVKANAYNNIDNLKNKDWSSLFWDWEVNDDMIDYFQSNSFKTEAIHYFNDLNRFILHVIKFKIVAIESYKEIAKLKSKNTPLPKHVNYTYQNPEVLAQFTGVFQIVKKETGETANIPQFEFIIAENQLNWHYTYQDVNYNDDFNVPLYWHKNHMFFNFLSTAIWEFNNKNESKIIFTARTNGRWNSYEKK
ncbi:DUF6090 family protein [Flavobacteriaceae bacterium KMM 6898]|nr:DUF6090 family protein [Flavobacteriaceae bacterium KMM 6898]